jgi:hypothetical protein
MDHDGKSQNGNKHETDGDNNKIGKKSEKPNQSYEEERTENERGIWIGRRKYYNTLADQPQRYTEDEGRKGPVTTA